MSTKPKELFNFSDYITIGKAAQLLGISKTTLRNWDMNGLLKCHRHPISGYRLYKLSDIEALLEQTEKTRR